MSILTLQGLMYIASKGQVNQEALQEALGVTSTTTSRMCARLGDWEKHNKAGLGFIIHEPDPQDRRYRIIRLSDKGEKFVDRLLKAASKN